MNCNVMHAPFDDVAKNDIAKKLAANLSRVGTDGVRRVTLDEIAKALGLDIKKVMTSLRSQTTERNHALILSERFSCRADRGCATWKIESGGSREDFWPSGR